jgi:NarL family two-component system response regulator LiaR
LPYAHAVRRIVLLYGLCGGLLIAALKAAEYRFVVVEHSIEIYGGVIAFLFAAVGIWLGLTLTRSREASVASDVPLAASQPFVADDARALELGLTRRELDILREIATGKSTREIADALFVSENTVKTHASRLFGKLNVRRRTQAVHVAKQLRLIP